MKILFLHQNFPGQYKHLFDALKGKKGVEVIGVGERELLQQRFKGLSLPPGASVMAYKKPPQAHTETHRYVRGLEDGVHRGMALAALLLRLKKKGFYPNTICVHPGWGEGLFLKDIFPNARMIAFLEFYYLAVGADAGFDPRFPLRLDDHYRIRLKNAVLNQALLDCDIGLSPTEWQKRVHPDIFHPKIVVQHDGIDTDKICPDPEAQYALPNGLTLRLGDPVITFVNRNLEPYRGFDRLMYALPEIQKRQPNAHVIIIGGNGVSYSRPAKMSSYKSELLQDLEGQLDLSRIHFTGRVPYPEYLRLLQISAAHVYFTYPFVLSWSMLEAMATGCVVIGSRTAPVEEVIVDGKNGYLTDFFDSKELADHVDHVLNFPQKQQTIRQAARQTVIDRYDLHRICLPKHLKLIFD